MAGAYFTSVKWLLLSHLLWKNNPERSKERWSSGAGTYGQDLGSGCKWWWELITFIDGRQGKVKVIPSILNLSKTKEDKWHHINEIESKRVDEAGWMHRHPLASIRNFNGIWRMSSLPVISRGSLVLMTFCSEVKSSRGDGWIDWLQKVRPTAQDRETSSPRPWDLQRKLKQNPEETRICVRR